MEVIVMTPLLNDDVVVVRGRLGWCSSGAPGQRCVVVGSDATASSEAALAYAGGWAERNRGAVVIVHVDALRVRRWRSARARWSALLHLTSRRLTCRSIVPKRWHSFLRGGRTSTSAATWRIN
jgi:hypothetical protein